MTFTKRLKILPWSSFGNIRNTVFDY
jgi:hypothetical protein